MTTGVHIVHTKPANNGHSASFSQSSYGSSTSSSRIFYSRDELLNLAASPLARSPPNFDTSVIPNFIAGNKVAEKAVLAPVPASPSLSDHSHDHHHDEHQFTLEL